MNTTKQVNVIMGLLMVGAFATLLYFIWENAERQDSATARQLQTNAERGGTLFAANCSSCHGLTGQGLIERGGLPGAPLNVEDNRATEADAVRTNILKFRETIRCGKVGTLMPAWSNRVGGTLNDFQILQLVALITGVMPPEDVLPEQVITASDIPADPNTISLNAWEHVVEEINHAQDFDPPRHLTQALDESATTLELDSASGLEPDQVIRLGGESLDDDYELVKIVKVDENRVEVERGVDGTDAAPHEDGTEAFQAPTLPGTTINESSCGQTARASDGGEAIEVSGPIEMTLGDDFFDLDGKQNPTLAIKTGTSITVTVSNGGKNFHNMLTVGADGEFDTDDDGVSDPDTIGGGESGTLTFTFAEPGTYAYKCGFHPIAMKGEIAVTE